jgi:uncharacterized Tic20 family protein
MTNAPEQPAAPAPQQPSAPPRRDTTLAWLAHLLMILTGFIAPLIIWLVKKDDDKYAAFHAKQAFVFSIAAGILTVVLMPFCGIGALVWLAATVYAIFAIIKTSKGEPFKYILVADWFCKKDFAEAYPELAATQPETPAEPPAQQPPQQ